MAPHLLVHSLTCSYDGVNNVVENVNIVVENASLVFIIGRVGAGKTTILKGIFGLVKCKGEVKVDGVHVWRLSMAERARLLAYVPQYLVDAPIPVYEAVLTGRYPYSGLNPSKHDIAKVDEVLRKLEIIDLRERLLTELSGGQLRLIMIARALVQEPRVLLLDEPTANLDPAASFKLAATLKRIVEEENVIVIAATHDLAVALNFGDRIIGVKDGRIVFDKKPDEVAERELSSLYNYPMRVVDADGRVTVVPQK